MFIHHLNIFKKKEEKYEVSHPELTRKNRVEKGSRRPDVRPRTAPGVLELPTQESVSRPSFQNDVQLADKPLPAPVPLYAAARLPNPRDEFSPPPFTLRRSLSSASCVIRNPFRRDTSESVATIGHLPEGSSESVNIIPQLVSSHTPTRRMTPPCIAPQRAIIFKTQLSLLDFKLDSPDSEPPAVCVPLARSKSLNTGELSCVEKPVGLSLRRSSHDDILPCKRSSPRAH